MIDAQLANHYQKIVESITKLAKYERYEGALVFGSFATGQLHPESDLDVSVVVKDEQNCTNVSHPVLDGIRVDISFNSLENLVKMTEDTLEEGLRKPWIYDGVILFDKWGRLQQLKERVLREAQPLAGKALKVDTIQFEMYYRYIKPQKYLQRAPATANLIMHMQLAGVLRFHYKIQRRWWVSDKNIFTDLAEWDPTMEKMLQAFLEESIVEQKYRLWTKIIDYILLPVGGKAFSQFEKSCDCDRCQADINRLIALCANNEMQ